AGTPLMEIVSEPDMHSSEEVFAYLTSLKNTISCAGISDCDMEKGQMRCDVNVSVRPKGSKEFGVKVEMKNINSISNARNSIDYEIKRQIDCLKKGVQIVQETRRWDAQLGITQSMVAKRTHTTTAISPIQI
ncbi:MAG: Asp-tRNA(Asn)/Glu-tRNA(Gln) amidotransferase GatCAB subunit B, partial [Bacilli bacterium]